MPHVRRGGSRSRESVLTTYTSRTPEAFYPQLHLFFHLALAGGLVIKKGKKSSTVLAPTERIAAYRELSNAEKYFYLFDFGDEWLFDVNVQAINEGEPILLHPKIVEQQGEAPRQYGYDEDEGDWDEDEEGLEDEG